MASTLIIVLIAVLGFLLTLGGIIGVWLAVRTAQNTQTVKNFREAASSWREKAEALASDLLTVQGEMAELQKQHKNLQAEHDVLKNVVTGKSAIESLGVQMTDAREAIILEVRLSKEALEQLIDARSGSQHE
jgi:uncharacterized coiled-coil DUF342 family protein